MATSRIAGLLHRQWHKSHIQSTSQLLVQSSRIEQPSSTNWGHYLQQQQRQPQQNYPIVFQQQQVRYQSDHLNQRAIDALKSKNNISNAAASVSNSNQNKGGGVGKSRNVGGSTGDETNNEGPRPAAAAAAAVTSSQDDASVKTVDPVQEPPPAASSPSPMPDSTSNAAAVAASNSEEKIDGDGDHIIINTDNAADIPNNANADGSNPWAHMVRIIF